MSNIESNAIKIAELLGYELVPSLLGTEVYYHLGDSFTQNEVNRLFSSYNGLMPIVFECRRTGSKYFISIGNDYIALDSHISGWINETTVVYNRDSETEFIKAIQLACIKYLELKNGNSLGS